MPEITPVVHAQLWSWWIAEWCWGINVHACVRIEIQVYSCSSFVSLFILQWVSFQGEKSTELGRRTPWTSCGKEKKEKKNWKEKKEQAKARGTWFLYIISFRLVRAWMRTSTFSCWMALMESCSAACRSVLLDVCCRFKNCRHHSCSIAHHETALHSLQTGFQWDYQMRGHYSGMRRTEVTTCYRFNHNYILHSLPHLYHGQFMKLDCWLKQRILLKWIATPP